MKERYFIYNDSILGDVKVRIVGYNFIELKATYKNNRGIVLLNNMDFNSGINLLRKRLIG